MAVCSRDCGVDVGKVVYSQVWECAAEIVGWTWVRWCRVKYGSVQRLWGGRG